MALETKEVAQHKCACVRGYVSASSHCKCCQCVGGTGIFCPIHYLPQLGESKTALDLEQLDSRMLDIVNKIVSNFFDAIENQRIMHRYHYKIPVCENFTIYFYSKCSFHKIYTIKNFVFVNKCHIM